MSRAMDWAKGLARTVWFREGTRRRCLVGPYAGLVFEIAPQMQMRMIVFYAAYEPEVSELLRRIVRPGMVLYDIGAHVGIHALYMAKLLKRTGRVYAFEAWPENYAVLERNIAHNPGLADIVPILGAVGDHDGIASVTRGANDGQHHVSLAGERVDLRTPALTLDTTCQNHVRPPALVLVDVEGGELSTLRGAEQLLKTYRPKLILEHHGQATDLVAWLSIMDYRVEHVGGRHLYAE